MSRRIEVVAVDGLPEVRPGDDLAGLILDATTAEYSLADGDVLVVSQKVVSKAENRLVEVDPDDPTSHKPLVLSESRRLLRRRGELLITETHHGFVCANAGVDRSNVAPEVAALLPVDPDRSARRIRDAIVHRAGTEVAVIVADTFGRPWRRGVTDIALGCAGIVPVLDLRGTADATGRTLQVTEVCIVDELAGAAELVRGKDTGVAVVVVRGVDRAWFADGSVVGDVVRSHEEDLFR